MSPNVLSIIEFVSTHHTLVFCFGIAAFISNVLVLAFWGDWEERLNQSWVSQKTILHAAVSAVVVGAVLLLNVLPTVGMILFVIDIIGREYQAFYDSPWNFLLGFYPGILFFTSLLSTGMEKVVKI